MKRNPIPVITIVGLLLAAGASITWAASGGLYSVNRFSLAAGRIISGGGNYTGQAAIGQAEAGWQSGGNYTASGGYLYQVIVTPTATATSTPIATSTPVPTTSGTQLIPGGLTLTPVASVTATTVPPTATPSNSSGGPTAIPCNNTIANLVKSGAQPPYAAPGDIITLTIQIDALCGTLNNVVVGETLPVSTTFISAGATQGELVYDPATRGIGWRVGTVTSARMAFATITARINSEVLIPTVITHQPVVTADGIPPAPANPATVHVGPHEMPNTGQAAIPLPVLGLAGRVAMPGPGRKRRMALIGLAAGLALAVGACASTSSAPDSGLPRLSTATAPDCEGGCRVTTLTPEPTGTLGWKFTAATLANWPTPTAPATATPWGLATLAAPEGEARLIIDALGVDAPIQTIPLKDGDWNIENLTNEVGWLATTGNQPGAELAPVLAGHVTLAPDGRAGPFKRLPDLKPGDSVTLRWPGVTYTYTVEAAQVKAPTEIAALYVEDGNALLLVTCLNWDSAAKKYQERLVVKAIRKND